MNDAKASQIKQILPPSPVAGASALPAPHMGQGVFHGDTLAQLCTPLRGLLAIAQLLQQDLIGMNADAAARGTRGTSRPQRAVRTGGRGKLDHSSECKRHSLSTRTTQFIPFPIQMEGTFGKIWPLPDGPGFTENGQVSGALLDQRTSQIRPVDVQFPQGALLRGQVRC